MMAIFAMAAGLGATGVAAAALMGAGGAATGAVAVAGAAAGTGAGVGFETASGSDTLDAVFEPLHANQADE